MSAVVTAGKLTPLSMHLKVGKSMVHHPAFAHLVSFPNTGRSYRSFERAISSDLDEMEVTTSHTHSVNWDRLLGIATLLVVCGGSWTAAGIAATYLFR
ncbi:MAG TPA: hypothetical protein VK829_09680 [Terriglobales bacterium]|nr:hypothetical protein [Terriglobales bacterium]